MQSGRDSTFQYKLLGEHPVPVSEISDALKALQSIYRSSVYRDPDLLKSFDEQLYVGKVKEGSQIYELVVVGIPLALPLVTDLNATAALFKNVQSLSNYFLRRAAAPKKIKAKDCTNVVNIVGPVLNSGSGLQISVVGEGSVTIENLTFQLTPVEAATVFKNAIQEKEKILSPEIEIHKNKVLVFIQANAVRTKTSGTVSPDKGVISGLSDQSHSIIFEEEIMPKKKALLKDNNFYDSSFLVDVQVVHSDNKIKAYVISKISLI